MLTIKNLSAGYENKVILNQVDLCVPEGSVMALIGPNGSGKTTLIRTISGVLPVLSGSIKIDGKNLSELNIQERSRMIAVVPQTRSLPPAFSIREVVALGRTPYLNWLGQLSENDNEAIKQAISQADLTQLGDRNLDALSGGEQQRVLLARALAQETPVLLMDEPTAHLDMQYQVNFLEIAHHLAHPTEKEKKNGVKGKAILIAIHDLNLLSKYADQVALLVHGKVEYVGTPRDVLTSTRLSKAYQLPLTVLHDKISGHSAVLPDS